MKLFFPKNNVLEHFLTIDIMSLVLPSTAGAQCAARGAPQPRLLARALAIRIRGKKVNATSLAE